MLLLRQVLTLIADAAARSGAASAGDSSTAVPAPGAVAAESNAGAWGGEEETARAVDDSLREVLSCWPPALIATIGYSVGLVRGCRTVRCGYDADGGAV
jgi:hypothetical protein